MFFIKLPTCFQIELALSGPSGRKCEAASRQHCHIFCTTLSLRCPTFSFCPTFHNLPLPYGTEIELFVTELYWPVIELYGNETEFYGTMTELYGPVTELQGIESEFYGIVTELYGSVIELYGTMAEVYGLQGFPLSHMGDCDRVIWTVNDCMALQLELNGTVIELFGAETKIHGTVTEFYGTELSFIGL